MLGSLLSLAGFILASVFSYSVCLDGLQLFRMNEPPRGHGKKCSYRLFSCLTVSGTWFFIPLKTGKYLNGVGARKVSFYWLLLVCEFADGCLFVVGLLSVKLVSAGISGKNKLVFTRLEKPFAAYEKYRRCVLQRPQQ